MKRSFQISSLDELPDYEELINKVQLIRGNDDSDDYLYKKDEYVEETAVAQDVKSNKQVKDDFDLPDISDEEIPDFLQGEDVEKF